MLTKTRLQPKRFTLVFRSDARGLNNSANLGRGHLRGTGLPLYMFTAPTVPMFQTTAVSSVPSRWRSALSITNECPVALTGPRQPRFNLVVTHVGIDDRELSALGDRIGGDSHPHADEPTLMLSRVTAGPGRLAAFSSSGCVS